MLKPMHRWFWGVGLISMMGLARAPAGPAENTPSETSAEEAPEGPLTLEEAIAQALAHNPQLAASTQAVGVAAARVGQAKAQDRFNLTANYRDTFQGPTVSFTVPDPSTGELVTADVVPDRTSSYSVNLRKTLWAGGRLKASQRLARRGMDASRQELRSTRQEVVLQVTEAYLGILKTQELREVARQTVTQAQNHRRTAQAHFEAGTAPRFDVLRAEVEVANAEERRLTAENGVELAKAALNNVLGQDPNRPIEATPVTPEITPAPELSSVLAQAMGNRPELAGLEQNIAASREGARVARSGRRPSVVLDANYNQQTATAFSDDFSWNASVVVSVPLWDGGLSRAQEAESRRQAAQLSQTYEQIRRGIELEVKQAWLNIEEARLRMATAATAVTQAEESARIARVRYEAGVSISTELFDAEVALTLARTNRVNATYDYILAWARLDKARGALAAP